MRSKRARYKLRIYACTHMFCVVRCVHVCVCVCVCDTCVRAYVNAYMRVCSCDLVCARLYVIRAYVNACVRAYFVWRACMIAYVPELICFFPSRPPAGTLMSYLAQGQQEYVARSAFTAITGSHDEFNTISDLVNGVRSGVYLDWQALPTAASTSDSARLNAYLYDFYRHGQLRALQVVNGIREGDAWNELREFSLILRTIAVALSHYDESRVDVCRVAFERLGLEYQQRFQKVWA